MNEQITALAIIALFGGVAILADSGLAAYHESAGWRRATYSVGAGLGLATAVICVYLLMEPQASTAWLWPGILAWEVHWMMARRTIATVAATSPGEQARGEVRLLKHDIANLEQTQNLLEGVTHHYQEWHETTKKALDALNDKYTDSNALVAELRHKLTDMVDSQMELKEKLIRARYEVSHRGGGDEVVR